MEGKKLTPLQAVTLALIATGAVSMRNHGTAAYRINGASPTVVGRLIAMGLAKWPKGHVGEQACEITSAGFALLTAIKGE